MKSLRGSKRKEDENRERISLRVKHKHLGGGEEEEMEELVYEEFDTENHEILAICLETESVSVGVSLFLSDREVEYYWEKFPECCVTHTKTEDFPVRNFITAVSVWGEKWTLAECVNILSQDEMVVRNISKQGSSLWRKAAQSVGSMVPMSSQKFTLWSGASGMPPKGARACMISSVVFPGTCRTF